MGIAVNLDANLIQLARAYSEVESRSLAKQIEHWAKVGRIVEDNPDLSYTMIKEILLGLGDMEAGRIEEYIPGSL